jgi:hypothetical protein
MTLLVYAPPAPAAVSFNFNDSDGVVDSLGDGFPAAFGVSVFVGFTPPGHRKPMLVSGIVRWTSASGVGVQFGSLGAREAHAITEIERVHGSSDPTSSG